MVQILVTGAACAAFVKEVIKLCLGKYRDVGLRGEAIGLNHGVWG